MRRCIEQEMPHHTFGITFKRSFPTGRERAVGYETIERIAHKGEFEIAGKSLLTQMRADILRIPVKVSEVSESTVLGASMFAFAGAGVYSTPEQARAAFGITYRTYMPGSQEAAYEKFNQ